MPNDIANTKAHTRKAYKPPLTQEQKDLINDGKAAFPVSEGNIAFDNNIRGLCGNQACKSAVEAWWSGLTSPQLVSVSDFTSLVNVCKTCSGGKKCAEILQSMSQLMKIDSLDSKKRSVKQYEITQRKTIENG